MIFDTHAHYYDDAFDPDRDALLSSLPEKGVELVVCPGCDLASSRQSQALAERYAYLYFAAGFHPENLEGMTLDQLDQIRALCAHPKCVAVGEIGLDYYWVKTPEERAFSREVFAAQLALAQELDCRAVDNAAVAAEADYIFLGVKPYMVAGLMEKIGPVLAARKDRFVLVSMAAALTIPDLRERGCGDWPLIRIMPNTPSAIGEGVIFYTCDGVTAEEEAAFLENMAGAGRLLPLDDHLMDAGSAVAGCGPAFVDLFIEAMADGGVACGLTRPMAMECAAQTLIGAARLMLETGRHPGALKDAVCSPGGATIQGVRALEAGGFRSAVMEAVIAAYEKSAEMK